MADKTSDKPIDKVVKTDAEWRAQLTAEQYKVARQHGTERAFSGVYALFVYNYAINCAPEDEMRMYHHPIQRIIVEETLRLGGSMCHHHGIGGRS